ncbi:MAG: ATPase, partial [Deferrisomatales bacterium]
MGKWKVEALAELTGQHPVPAYCPAPPQSLAEMDVSEGLLSDLVLRRLYLQGEASLTGLCRSLMLSFPVAREVFELLRAQQLVQVKGIDGSDYRFVLTGAGRALAADRMLVCQYAGPCPVSLKTYQAAVRAQAAKVTLDRETLRAAFSDLV